jgi:O-antigen ligase
VSVANRQDEERPDGSAERRLAAERWLFALFLALIAWAPFPFGSNRLWAELLLGAGLGILAMAWALSVVLGLVAVRSVTHKLLLPALCYGAALIWAFVQTIDLAAVDRALATSFGQSLAHPVWSMAQDALGKPVGSFVSVDPALTGHAITRALFSIAAFVVAFQIGRDGRRARFFLQAFVVIAAVYAVMGMVTSATDFAGQAWLMAGQGVSEGRVAAPFMNANHFATYVGLGALCSLGLLVEGLRRYVVWDRERRVLVATLLHALTSRLTAWLTAFLILLPAVFLSQSRGGVFAFLAGALTLGAALLGTAGESQPRPGASSGGGRTIIFALLALLVAAAIWIGGAPLIQRLAGDRDGVAGRTEFGAATLEAIHNAPLLGLGFGAFERYFPFFDDGKFAGTVDKAHNDYLETVADLGVPAGLLFIAAPLILALQCAAGVVRRRRDRMFPAMGLAASVLVGAHALVDFALQIPAIAVTYAAILGVGSAQAWSTAKRQVD